MTKIEHFKALKRTANTIKSSVDKILGRDSPTNDKHYFDAKFSNLSGEIWSPMIIKIFASHGYYWSSSGYSDTSADLGKHLATAINEYKSRLLFRAVELAEEAAEQARKDAEEEAKLVLLEVGNANG